LNLGPRAPQSLWTKSPQTLSSTVTMDQGSQTSRSTVTMDQESQTSRSTVTIDQGSQTYGPRVPDVEIHSHYGPRVPDFEIHSHYGPRVPDFEIHSHYGPRVPDFESRKTLVEHCDVRLGSQPTPLTHPGTVLQPQTPPEKKSIGKLQKESQQLLAEVHLTLQLCELFVALCRGSPGARLAHSQALSL